jgi:hypothetical protein
MPADSAVGVASNIIPSTQVTVTSARTSEHTGDAGRLFSHRSWNSKAFYVCPDKIYRGSAQAVPQSMCNPDVGALEWWKMLQAKDDRYLHRQVAEQDILLKADMMRSKAELTKTRMECSRGKRTKKCQSFVLGDHAALRRTLAALKRQQASAMSAASGLQHKLKEDEGRIRRLSMRSERARKRLQDLEKVRKRIKELHKKAFLKREEKNLKNWTFVEPPTEEENNMAAAKDYRQLRRVVASGRKRMVKKLCKRESPEVCKHLRYEASATKASQRAQRLERQVL